MQFLRWIVLMGRVGGHITAEVKSCPEQFVFIEPLGTLPRRHLQVICFD